ncbi:MAG: UvrD-helicase domain-containing protein, partial [Candidatus Kapaibacterium sp.]
MLNDQQIAALDRHVHLAVVANAGSGKTSVLVERFMRILVLESVRLDQVVAITFTRAAAAEMRQRLQEKIDSISTTAKEQAPYLAHMSLPTLQTKLRTLSAQIGTARISTFHSFCAGLVRQYADVIGRSSDVRDADSRLTSELRVEAVDRAMKGLLGPNGINDPYIQQMLDVLTPWTVSSLVSQMTSNSAQRREHLAWYALPINELRSQRQRCVVQLQFEAGLELAARLRVHIQPYSASLPALDALCEELRDLQWRCSQNDDTAPAALVKLHETWFTTKREIRTAAIPKDQRGQDMPSPIPSDLELNLSIRSAQWDDAVEQRQIQVMHALGKLAEAAAREYAELKRRRNVIDFDDMIDDAMQLLRHEETSGVIRQSIAYVMIDEFQDTDPTQYELLELLAPALTGRDASGPNVYVVGDDKQSIYGFRDADVRLFRRARRAIRNANAIGPDDDDGIRPLAMSFRMHQLLISGVNDICRHAFGSVAAPDEDDEVSYDVAYLDLEAGVLRYETASLATVRLVPVPADDLRKQNEFAAVARQIAHILHPSSGSQVFDKDVPSRAPRAGDVAVLVPRNADKAMMAEALRELGIPYKVYGGRAFFSRPEIADVRAALTAAADPLSDLATATALRSSLLRCSDDDILAASLLGRTTSLQDGLAILAASDDASEQIVQASMFFNHLRTMLSLQPVSEVIGPMLSHCGWYDVAVHEPRSRQMVANVEKLIAICADVEQTQSASLADVLRAISVPEDDLEAEEVVLGDDNAVHLMTIHGSKGLEFPIVALAGLNTQIKTPSAITSHQMGPTCSFPGEQVDTTNLLNKQTVP